MGIADTLDIRLPWTKPALIFGRPEQHLAERATLMLADHCTRSSLAFIDVGANEGLFTFYVSEMAGRLRPLAVHSFEPDPYLFERLSDNVKRNGIAANIRKAAASDTSGQQQFHRNLADDLSGSLSDHFVIGNQTIPTTVETVSLGRYLEENDIRHACVKVDVEGAGLRVWQGLKDHWQRIDWLIYEIIGPEVEAGLPGLIIKKTGWHAYYIRDFELEQSANGSFNYVAPFYNWLFCPHAFEALTKRLEGTRFRVRTPEVKLA